MYIFFFFFFLFLWHYSSLCFKVVKLGYQRKKATKSKSCPISAEATSRVVVLPDFRSLSSIFLFCCCLLIRCFSWTVQLSIIYSSSSFWQNIFLNYLFAVFLPTSISFRCWLSLSCLMLADGRFSILEGQKFQNKFPRTDFNQI